jgi:starch phosphorylase
VARVVNSDPTVRNLLKVAFLPNYNVSLAEMIVPAADLSEQISTPAWRRRHGQHEARAERRAHHRHAGRRQCRDHERVGRDNIFIFGLTTRRWSSGARDGWRGEAAIAGSERLAEVIEQIESGVFSPDDPGRYRDLMAGLREHDHFMVAADFDAYCDAQRRAAERRRDKAAWWRSAVLNTANMGWFSSDRTIAEYAGEIWQVPVRR